MRFFLIFSPLAVILAVGVLYSSTQRFRQESTSGCNLPPPGATGQFQETRETAIFNNQPITFQMAQLTPTAEALAGAEGAVLGATTEQRWIEIDLSEQKLYAHNGDKIDYEFLVSSGKWAPTPIGEFHYFYKGFGIHGTYWHNNFGTPKSHGCVNISILDAEKLFYWAAPVLEDGKGVVYSSKDNPGTRVVIHD